MEVVVTAGAIKRAKLQSQCHHQHQHLLNFNQTINLSVSDQMHPVSILREKIKRNIHTYRKLMKNALGETQTLRAGCSKAELKIFAPPQTLFPGTQN